MTTAYYFQLIGWLILLILILYCVIYLGRTYRTRHYRGNMKIVDRLPITTQTALLVIEIRGKSYLFSMGGKKINLLSPIDD